MTSRTVRAFRTLAIATTLSGATACTAILGLDEKPLGATTPDASADGAATSACPPDDAGYHDPSTKGCWETFPITIAFDPDPAYSGGAFDGRYVYFASNSSALIVRYDTMGDFPSSNSWSQYETQGLQGDNEGAYAGAVFDGRYMYFVPTGEDTTFVRYDTKGADGFDSNSSWSHFSLGSDDPIAYIGGTFDGRYIYFAPLQDANGENSGAVERYDTSLPFTTKASWSSFDATTVTSSLAKGASAFFGSVFDGKRVYFIPSGYEGNVVVAYDTTADFNSPLSWQLFDTGNVNSQVAGFSTGMFDGKYIYLIPVDASEVVLQYDISGPFIAKASWSQYNVSPGSGMIGEGATPTFSVGAFDGRNLYFAPGPIDDGVNGLLARYDNLTGFTSMSSWSTFDTDKVNKTASFGAAVFDGQYLYLAPSGTTAFTRFNARATPFQPLLPHFFGSFY